MIPSVEGLLVAALLLLIGFAMGAPLIVGLLASLPFGATAFATLTALGGSSPLIYTLFSIAVILAVFTRKDAMRRLGMVFAKYPVAWLVLALIVYTIVSALLFPRFFAGRTTAFVPIEGLVTELPLGPTSGNITQTAYFTLGAFVFIAISMTVLDPDKLKSVTRGLFAFAAANALLGGLDLAGKLAGAGDILLPIRTASYSLLTDVAQAGFWRIAGGFSEASAFAAMSLSCLAFCYAYWRVNASNLAFALMVALLLLVLLSTSTTGYAGLALLSLAPIASLMKAIVRNRFQRDDLALTALGILIVAALGLVYINNQHVFDPIVQLVQETILDKPQSSSGQERSYWNEKSLQSFLDTSGLGVGMGSSRSSSWIVSVIAQLGILGTIIMLALFGVIVRGMSGIRPTRDKREVFALAAGARASAIALIVAGCISGAHADPGVLFFIALSTVVAARALCQEPISSIGERRLQIMNAKGLS